MKEINDTAYFHFYNANPKNKRTTDCVIRALAVALDRSWEEVYRDLVEFSIKHSLMVSDMKCFDKYLDKLGFTKLPEPRKLDNTKMSVKEYLSRTTRRTFICNAGSHHLTVVKDGKVWDIWDSSSQTIHTIWERR